MSEGHFAIKPCTPYKHEAVELFPCVQKQPGDKHCAIYQILNTSTDIWQVTNQCLHVDIDVSKTIVLKEYQISIYR